MRRYTTNLAGEININSSEFYSDFIQSLPGLIIHPNTNLSYNAANFVLLQSDAEIKEGAEVLLNIDECRNE